MKRNLKKMMAVLLFVSIHLTQITPNIHIKAEDANSQEKSYVIVTNSFGKPQLFNYIDSNDCSFEENCVLEVELTEEYAKEISNLSGVEYIEEDIEMIACGTEQKLENEPEWNMQMIHADNKRESVSEQKVKIAVIDSGVNYTDDVNVVERRNFVEGDNKISVLYEDGSGHGTAIAGIIGAKDNNIGITGINPNIEIYSVRVLDDNNRAMMSRVIAAIEWAIEQNVNIINLSLGCNVDSEILHTVIKKAENQGILLIAAAGNGGEVMYPAAYEEVIAVGSVGTDGKVSEHSSVGNEIELVAPGEQILSTGMFDGFITCGGSSIAAAHVTGVAAAMWEQDLAVSSDFIRKLLDASARQYEDKNSYGYGLIDMENTYANYENFKSAYIETSTIDEICENVGIEKNNEIVPQYTDVDYVEGLWTKDQHQSMATDELEIVKKGAIANDDYIKKMSVHPRWHGFYKTKSGNRVNYVSCYMYLTLLAKNIGNGIYSVSSSNNEYQSMEGKITSADVNGTTWKQILPILDSGTAAEKRNNRKLFVYGMALHVATDVFSHSTFTLDGNYIRHELRDEDYDEEIDNDGVTKAHDASYCSNRYTCAKDIAAIVLDKCKKGLAGGPEDFYSSSFVRTGSTSFRLKNISKNIKEIDSTYYSNNKVHFDNMNKD